MGLLDTEADKPEGGVEDRRPPPPHFMYSSMEESLLNSSNRSSVDGGRGTTCCGWRHPTIVEFFFFFFILAHSSSLILQNTYLHHLSLVSKIDNGDVLFNQKHHADYDEVPWNAMLVLPVPVESKTCESSNVTDLDREVDKVSWETKEVFWAASALPAVLVTLILSPLGDTRGRALGLLLPCVGGILKSAMYLLHAYFKWSKGLLLVGHLLEGLSGWYGLLSASAFCYVADAVRRENRGLRFSLLYAVGLLAKAAAIPLANIIVQLLGCKISFAFTLGVFTLLFIYGIFILPESLPECLRSDDRLSPLHLIRTLPTTCWVYSRPRAGRLQLCGLIIASNLTFLVLFGGEQANLIQVVSSPLCMSHVNLLLAWQLTVPLSQALACSLLLRVCLIWLRHGTIAMAAAICAVPACVLQAVALYPPIIFAAVIVGAPVAMLIPLTLAMMSLLVQADEQGAVVGSVCAVQLLFHIGGSALFTSVVRVSSAIPPGCLISVAYALIYAIVIACIWSVKKNRPKSYETL